MASWSAFAAWNNISWSGLTRTLTVGPRYAPGRSFWSTGSAFGTWEPGSDDAALGTLEVVHGELKLEQLVLDGLVHKPTITLTAGSSWMLTPGRASA
jgi:non-lysosomal glucosylceramidase